MTQPNTDYDDAMSALTASLARLGEAQARVLTERKSAIRELRYRDGFCNAAAAAWREQDNPGYSDLDSEQPISLTVRCTLGDIRRMMMTVDEPRAIPTKES